MHRSCKEYPYKAPHLKNCAVNQNSKIGTQNWAKKVFCPKRPKKKIKIQTSLFYFQTF